MPRSAEPPPFIPDPQGVALYARRNCADAKSPREPRGASVKLPELIFRIRCLAALASWRPLRSGAERNASGRPARSVPFGRPAHVPKPQFVERGNERLKPPSRTGPIHLPYHRPKAACAAGGAVQDSSGADAASLGETHIGIDEAGRGCLAGPVVAAAALFPPRFDFAALLPGLTDSKKLSEKQRNVLINGITSQASAYGLGFAWQDEIDNVNILSATFRAMSRAVLALADKISAEPGRPCSLPTLAIDGNRVIPIHEWLTCAQGVPVSAVAWEQYLLLPATRFPGRVPSLPDQKAVVRGDALIPSISAASVLAKVVRDGLMARLDEFYPGYGLARHKGYGTKEHLEALLRLGPSPLHRKTFNRVCRLEALPGMEP